MFQRPIESAPEPSGDKGSIEVGQFPLRKRVSLDISDADAIFGFYAVWLTVDTTGDVWVLDSHYTNTVDDPPRILQVRFDDATRAASQVKSFLIEPDGLDVPRLYGVDISSEGVLFISDA